MWSHHQGLRAPPPGPLGTTVLEGPAARGHRMPPCLFPPFQASGATHSPRGGPRTSGKPFSVSPIPPPSGSRSPLRYRWAVPALLSCEQSGIQVAPLFWPPSSLPLKPTPCSPQAPSGSGSALGPRRERHTQKEGGRWEVTAPPVESLLFTGRNWTSSGETWRPPLTQVVTRVGGSSRTAPRKAGTNTPSGQSRLFQAEQCAPPWLPNPTASGCGPAGDRP